ncbi:DUF2244 domain-containing protein [Janthinobacterium sp. Mn2066]|uniref:DUF2244 domain-containing protein n=1 Tax=Janthinobacterium sp. Mn2066 TaxID=3395264 RepID=UPI003BDF053E
MPRDCSREQPEWRFIRHSALTARQLLRAYGLLCFFSIGIALAFALRGYWYISLFSVLELSAVAAALLYYQRHARDYEQISLRDGVLLVEQVSARRCRRSSFEPWSARISVPRSPRQLIRIAAPGRHVDVGRYATHERRRQVAQELRALLPGLPPLP